LELDNGIITIKHSNLRNNMKEPMKESKKEKR